MPRKECTSVPREVCAPEPIRECVQVSSSWTSAKFYNIQEQCQVLTILRCRENSAEWCQVRLALKFLCCSVFRCASLAYHANPCSLESSFPLPPFPSSKKASDEVVYLGRDLLLSELAFKDSIIKLTEKTFSRVSIVQDDIRSKCNDLFYTI